MKPKGTQFDPGHSPEKQWKFRYKSNLRYCERYWNTVFQRQLLIQSLWGAIKGFHKKSKPEGSDGGEQRGPKLFQVTAGHQHTHMINVNVLAFWPKETASLGAVSLQAHSYRFISSLNRQCCFLTASCLPSGNRGSNSHSPQKSLEWKKKILTTSEMTPTN